MSAITGIFYRDRRNVDPPLIKKINDILSHRGPDGSITWCDGPVGLGHQMLWTTPESLHETLPFHDEKSGLVITADARIDNRKDLSEELRIEDKEDISDSYFILKAYEKWGEKCPEYLLGDFAFAIWDETEEKLFCARDHMGIKQFYYYLDDKVFVFGTEIKSIFSIPEVSCELNEKMIAFYLVGAIPKKKLTFYKNIFSLNPANSLTITDNKINKNKYWNLNHDLKIVLGSDEEYISVFREIFAEAINCRLRSAFQIGFELSGGLDSSSVVCMTKNILKSKNCEEDINTYSMVFDTIPESDESKYIKKIVNSGGINSKLIPSDKVSPLKNINSKFLYQDQPFNAGNIGTTTNRYEKIQKDGIRILLGGYGGDQVVSIGKNHIRDLAVKLKWKKLIKEILAVSKNANRKPSYVFYILVFIPLLPKFIKNISKKFLSLSDTNKEEFILNEEFSTKMGGEDYLKSFKFNSIARNVNTARKYHYLSINVKTNQKTLELLDPIAGVCSIEPRFPFLDKRLIEFCYGIPDQMKFSLVFFLNIF